MKPLLHIIVLCTIMGFARTSAAQTCDIPDETIPLTGSPEKFTVTTHWLPQCQFAGIYMAQAKGFYAEAGLEVEILHSTATYPSIEAIKEGNTDIITTWLTEALIARDSGIPLVNILQTSHRNSTMIISHKPIREISDLDGMKIGKWLNGFYETAICFALYNNLNIEWIPFPTDVNIFLSGAMDATLAMEYNEYFQVLMAGVDISPEQIIRLADVGFNIPEEGFYMTEEAYRKRPDAVRRFVEATKRGWDWVRQEENFNETIDYMMKMMREMNVSSSRVNQEHMLRVTLEAQKDENGNVPYTLPKKQYDTAIRMMVNSSLLFNPVDYTTFVKTL